MAKTPPKKVVDAFLAPIAHITRRVEIYEEDGKTPWRSDLWDTALTADSGSVNASFGDKERRTFECVLDNSGGDFDPVPGALWYDKVFKVFYGIDTTVGNNSEPKVVIIEEDRLPGQAQMLRSIFADAGVGNVHFNPNVIGYWDIQDADIIVSISATGTKKYELLETAYANGKSVLTFSGTPRSGSYPAIFTSTTAGALPADSYVVFDPVDTRYLGVATRWQLNPPVTYNRITSTQTGTVVLADASVYDSSGVATSPGVIVIPSDEGARWVHVAQSHFDKQYFADSSGTYSEDSYSAFRDFTAATIRWLDATGEYDYYECQIGEFVSTSLGHSDDTGLKISVSGIDYTKRCNDSKLVAATMFEEGEVLEDVIAAVASNAGIRKLNLPITGEKLQKDITFERDTSRWDVIRKLAYEMGFDLYFDGQGRLTMAKFSDPAEDAPNLVLRSGEGGNLVSRKLMSSDAQLFNHVVVVGESSDSNVPPVYAEALNAAEGSPTSIYEIGDRVKIETMSSVTEKAKAQELADKMLAVSILEEFELSFSSVFFPWVEPGELVEYSDETRPHWGPSRYLITSLSLPLNLGPMTGSGKRVVNLL